MAPHLPSMHKAWGSISRTAKIPNQNQKVLRVVVLLVEQNSSGLLEDMLCTSLVKALRGEQQET